MNIVESQKQTAVSVETATEIIMSHRCDFGNEQIDFRDSIGRVLAQNILADTDHPPFDRITMDGVAINYDAFAKGIRSFRIAGIQAAGNSYLGINNQDECIEVMTGAALDASLDTIIRYEDVAINNGIAEILVDEIRKGQNIHSKGSDRKKNDVVAETNLVITPALVAVLASTGNIQIEVKKLPRVLIVSTGNEIVEVTETPGPFEIRSSNKYVVQSALQQYGIGTEIIHLSDDREFILKTLNNEIHNYEVVILCGGVSKGKFDFVPEALHELGVEKLFHFVLQRPGKPFWFGKYKSIPVFAFPGNPGSVFLCLYRYLLPWLELSLGIPQKISKAMLGENVRFSPNLNLFLPVNLSNNEGCIIAKPVKTNGSGDFINLLQADAFIELPAEKDEFFKDDVYPVWPFKKY